MGIKQNQETGEKKKEKRKKGQIKVGSGPGI
jgi:hypothetical protein